MYREVDDLQSHHYNKYFYGLLPDDNRNKFYYGMSNPTYYGHNSCNVASGDINDGNYREGDFKLQIEGR